MTRAGSGIVLCIFEKYACWPLTKEEIRIRTVVVEKLVCWSLGKDTYEMLHEVLDRQFTNEEMRKLKEMIRLTKQQEQQEKGPPPRYLYLRMCIKSLMTTHYAEYEAEFVVAPERERNVFFWIKAKMGLKRDKAGRPLMELVFDTRGEGWPVSEIHKSTFLCRSPLMLNQLLIRNHLITDPSDWQRRKVQANPSFKPSFLVTLDIAGANGLEGSFEEIMRRKIERYVM